jgi:hypothetical protein
MQWTLLPLLAVLPMALGGCTAVRASYYLLDAQRKFESAVNAGAEQRAPYEFTLAEQYLQKAREEDGYSDFGAAEMLSRKSIEYAAAAFEKASDEGRPDVSGAESIVPEEKKEEPPKEQGPDIDIDLDDP